MEETCIGFWDKGKGQQPGLWLVVGEYCFLFMFLVTEPLNPIWDTHHCHCHCPLPITPIFVVSSSVFVIQPYLLRVFAPQLAPSRVVGTGAEQFLYLLKRIFLEGNSNVADFFRFCHQFLLQHLSAWTRLAPVTTTRNWVIMSKGNSHN